MAFFLLGRVDDTLNLLCPNTFSSRQEALAALSRVTAEPGFELWDAEVLLLDTDSGTPVLLVRPQTAPTDPAIMPDSDVVVVPEPDVEPLESIVVDEVVATPETEPEMTVDEDASTDAVLTVEDPALADAIMEEFEAEEQANPADALKAALSRTAAQMEAEGIVAPESIGAADPETASDPLPETEPADATATEPEDAIDGEDVAVSEDELPVESTVESAPTVEKEWPWDVAAEVEPAISPEIAFVISDLEEPSLDDASILRGSIDDETFATARPMIMGAYSEPREDATSTDTVEVSAPVESMGSADSQVAPFVPSSSGFAVPVVGDAADIFPLDSLVDAAESIQEEADSAVVEGTDDRDLSDFILDIGAVPVADATESSPDTAEMDQYTCEDCIYEDTCPNRDQRHPKDCGSFQWR